MSRTIEALQRAISYAGIGVLVDGRFGRNTSRAFEKLPSAARRSIVRALNQSDDPFLITAELFEELTKEVFLVYDLTGDIASLLVRLEPSVITLNSTDYVDLTATSSLRYKGPFQISRVAWKHAVHSEANIINLQFAYSSLEDPTVACHVAAMYVSVLTQSIERKGLEITPELQYALYNQGPVFLERDRQNLAAIRAQSADARAVLSQAARQLV